MFRHWRLVLVVLFATLLIPFTAVHAQTEYTVQPGDTLSRIASRTGASVADIMDANGLANPNLIYVGQALIIPGAAPAAAETAPPAAPVPVAHPTPAPIVLPPPAPSQALSILTGTDPIYQNIVGPPDFVAQMTRVIQWLEVNDPGAFELLVSFTDGIRPSDRPTQAYAEYVMNGEYENCTISMLYMIDDVLTASLLYHEVFHCMRGYQHAWGTEAQEEILAYTEQKYFLQRHGVDPFYTAQIDNFIARYAEIAAHEH